MAIDLDKERAGRPAPLRVVDASDFQGKPVPERDWLIPQMLLRRSVTLVNGDGGVGKSLLMMQLQVAAALGEPWLGLPMPADGITSFALYCEDDEEEVQRRLADVLRFYNASFADLHGRVLFMSRVGEINEMMKFGWKNDTGQRTALFNQVEDQIRMRGVQLTVLDTVADVFMGNENIRPQVRGFITAIRRLALINNGGVLITAHPSRAGMADGTGLSGSTGWNGSVRSRIYLTKPKVKDADIDGEEGQTNERILKTMKSNYGASGDVIRLRWENGVFMRTDTTGGSLLDRLDDDRKVLEAARWLIGRGNLLSPSHVSRTALATLVTRVPSCKDITQKKAFAAQERMLGNGKLVTVEMGPKSKRVLYIRPTDMRYPGEPEVENGQD